MNYNKKRRANMIMRNSFFPTYGEGCLKWSNETYDHFKTKSDLLYWFKKQGYEVWSEARLGDGRRPDLIAIKDQFGWIIEVIHTESDKRFKEKLEASYGDFIVIRVETKGFDINTFKL